VTVKENRPGTTEAASLTSPNLTARCRRCGRPVWALRSVQREAGVVCWRHIHTAAVKA